MQKALHFQFLEVTQEEWPAFVAMTPAQRDAFVNEKRRQHRRNVERRRRVNKLGYISVAVLFLALTIVEVIQHLAG